MNLSGLIYTCIAGEKWDEIAANIYGDSKYAADLLCANPDHCRTMVFTGGEKLYLPVIEIYEENEDDTDFMSEIAPWKEA